MKKLLLVALSTAAMSSAHAWEPTYYAGGSISTWQFKQHTITKNFNFQSLEASAGAVVYPNVSVEVRAGTGLTSGRETVFSTEPPENEGDDPIMVANEYEVELNYYASGYFRPFLANETASLYGLLGVTTMEVEGFEDSETDLSYGFGVSFAMSGNMHFVAEWKKLINAEQFDMRGATAGFIYKF